MSGEELRRLSKKATPGRWFIDESCGYLVGGLRPDQDPDREAGDDEALDLDHNPFEGAPLCTLMQDGGPVGEHDPAFIVALVNAYRNGELIWVPKKAGE